ncbi:putative two component, sigma54 specific, transcriptional regulator [Solidesulfovibrio carbinoliphilus subsp. oakridgensis]|uniref:Two component, sigma54 specific, transcriptional regulator n=1 Tax=Solidesulfovibrio carbinoliphilus subsp. oakridgensis TaxID=694327 RepID=G7Q793_9BACT|nr:sigma-54 dependent transcriptional regulator [Solidesulfovibrio carbinoliphilus]EHJ49050.1 putative two component, sigma54 specific, transcriptional regulator [Solidesulfovibrio carbinoliphilus subsp. oakridgensis]
MGNVLIIDDDQTIRDALARVVSRLGHRPDMAATLAEGLRLAGGSDVDVVFLDVRMPDGNGLDAISDIRRAPSTPEVIVLTGWGDPDGAERAMRQGAWDYIEKPPTVKTMTAQLVSAMDHRSRGRGAARTAESFRFLGIAGGNPKREQCLEQAAKAAASDVNVLLTGPTGAGKELFARAIHGNSPRRDGPFVVVDCAALPAGIVESVLFGSEKGVYTGADRRREGLLLRAHEGTLFLDEVAEMPLSVQKAFLRVLQERRVRPLGGLEEAACHFRLVAATNQDLAAMAGQGLFREDLLFRLQGVGIELPPLAGHPEDILDFAAHFAGDAAARLGTPARPFSEEFSRALLAYSWPGNVRELKNTLEGALALAAGGTVLLPVHLPLHIRVCAARNRVTGRLAAAAEADGAGLPSAVLADAPLPRFRDYRDSREADYLRVLSTRFGGDIGRMLDVSGLSRSRLYALLKKHGIPAVRS